MYTKMEVLGDTSTITWGLVMRRNATYFLFRALFLLWVLSTCSLSAYIVQPEEVGARLEVGATMLVAAMAVLFVFTSDMPKTGVPCLIAMYESDCNMVAGTLNRLDYLFLSTIIAMTTPLVQTMVVYGIYLENSKEGTYPNEYYNQDAVGFLHHCTCC